MNKMVVFFKKVAFLYLFFYIYILKKKKLCRLMLILRVINEVKYKLE